MNDEKMMRIFFEIHSGLPREGPGDRRSTLRALSLLPGLPPRPRVLDVGCGPGMQTLVLLEAVDGTVVAVDNHQPFLDQLAARVQEKGLAHRIEIINADMADLPFEAGSFDLVWSEGAAYSMGFDNALVAWKPLLGEGGGLAVTELTWLRSGRPEELQRFFDDEYPPMRDIDENLRACRQGGYTVEGHFVLPDSAWWDDYYMPIEKKLPVLREKYANDPAALEVVAMHEMEIEMFKKYPEYYGYVFYVLRV